MHKDNVSAGHAVNLDAIKTASALKSGVQDPKALVLSAIGMLFLSAIYIDSNADSSYEP